MSDSSEPTAVLAPDTLNAALDLVAEGEHDLKAIADFIGVPRRALVGWLTGTDETNTRYQRALAICEGRRRERVLGELERIAFFDIATCYDENGILLHPMDMPETARKTIQKFEQNELHIGGNQQAGGDKQTRFTRSTAKGIELRRKVEFYSRVEALKLLGQNMQMFRAEIDVAIANPYQAVMVPVTQRLTDPDANTAKALEAEFTEVK
jgi:hypothetical protein